MISDTMIRYDIGLWAVVDNHKVSLMSIGAMQASSIFSSAMPMLLQLIPADIVGNLGNIGSRHSRSISITP